MARPARHACTETPRTIAHRSLLCLRLTAFQQRPCMHFHNASLQECTPLHTASLSPKHIPRAPLPPSLPPSPVAHRHSNAVCSHCVRLLGYESDRRVSVWGCVCVFVCVCVCVW